jgi:DNA-binding transcriptional ArsR family regulator
MTDLTQHPSSTDESEYVIGADDEIDQLLAALNDRKSRQILCETDQEALSAEELSERCDIPLSTVYRKLERLVDTGVLDERVRLSSHPQYTREYRLNVSSINIDIDGDSGVSFALSVRSMATDGSDQSNGRLSAD